MKLHVTTAIHDIAKGRFIKLLDTPELSKVNYCKDDYFTSYNLTEYSIAWSRFMHLLSERMRDELGDPYGVYTRKHSKDYLQRLGLIVNSITANDIITHNKRFPTWMD